jgi:hypothetical protein
MREPLRLHQERMDLPGGRVAALMPRASRYAAMVVTSPAKSEKL